MAHSHHHEALEGVDPGGGGGPRWRQALAALRYRDFRLVWTTSIFSSAARWVQQVSLGWLAFDLTDSAALLGVLLFVYQAPTFALSPLVGVLVDRVDRRRLLIVSQSAMAAVAVLLALDISLGYVQVWHLYVFAIVSGVESTIIHVVRQALIPAVVPREALLNAISLNSAALTSTRIVGPFLAGLLIVGVGVQGNFLIQAVLLTCVAIAAFPLRVKPLEPESGERSADGSIRQDIAIALRFIWSLPVLRVQFAIQYLMLFLAMPFSNFLPVWAADVLSLKADGLGVLYSAAGIGALVGTLALASAGNVRRKGLLMGTVTVGLGLAYLGHGPLFPAPRVAGAARRHGGHAVHVLRPQHDPRAEPHPRRLAGQGNEHLQRRPRHDRHGLPDHGHHRRAFRHPADDRRPRRSRRRPRGPRPRRRPLPPPRLTAR